MKVLLIDVYNYNKGGAETVCFNTGEMLKQHGHQVCYFTLKWEKNQPSPYSKYFPESKETRKGILAPFVNLVNYFYHFEAAKKMEQLIADEKPDIAHIHLLWGQITPSIFPVLKKHNIPVVFTVHDYRIVCPAYTFRNGKGEVCEQCQGKHFYKCFTNTCTKGSKVMSAVMAAEMYFRNRFFNPANYIDGFVYVSNFAKQKQEQYMKEVTSIPNVTLYNFSKSIVEQPKNKPDDPYYLFFGRLSYEKGVPALIDAFLANPQLNLKIVGTGPLEDELKQKVAQSGAKNISFQGYKTGNDLMDVVANAYFVIVPSEWYENNPMTIIESYSLGTPVIGARIGGIPEIIVDKVTGYLFNSGDVDGLSSKLNETALLSASEYVGLSNGCINFAQQNFGPINYYGKLEEFYKSFLKDK